MRNLLTVLLSLAMFVAFAQKKKKEDLAAIKSMCGCYEVAFNFAETFSPDKNYEKHDNYRSGALEYIFPVEETKDKIVLQHLLVIGDTMIIKHWRQDWLYENQELYSFNKDNIWNYQTLPSEQVKGQWTQKVYQVDDSPRYEGAATWIHEDGHHYWETTSDAPLPRRDATKRDDYNVMVRKNRQEITDYGWVHEQDNQKVQRGDEDVLLVREKGWNTYTKTDESKCTVAKKWWEANKFYWADVRDIWDEVFASKETVAIQVKVDDKMMFQRLFALGEEAHENYDSDRMKQKIRDVIRIHLKNEDLLASK